jgi:hypothetical protein
VADHTLPPFQSVVPGYILGSFKSILLLFPKFVMAFS